MSCPFCPPDLPAHTLHYGPTGYPVMVFEPLRPVIPGHLLVVPVLHVEDATTRPDITAEAAFVAARIAARCDSANIITSIGAPATQTVRHLHLHVVPRRDGDGLALPWTGQAS